MLFCAIFLLSIPSAWNIARKMAPNDIPPINVPPLRVPLPNERDWDIKYSKILGSDRWSFLRESHLLNWIPIITAVISAVGTVVTVFLALKNNKHDRLEQELRIAELERRLGTKSMGTSAIAKGRIGRKRRRRSN